MFVHVLHVKTKQIYKENKCEQKNIAKKDYKKS